MIFRSFAALCLGLTTALAASLSAAQGAAAQTTAGAAEGAGESALQDPPLEVFEEGAEPAPDAEVVAPFEMIRPASETSLEEWIWTRRPIVVFADNAADPRFVQQMQLLTERMAALEERDVVVITDTDPAARSSVRQKLRPRGFALTILAKDGSIIARKPSPWSVREISRSIDKQPLRQQEIRDRRESLR
jgi:hypothetical protein